MAPLCPGSTATTRPATPDTDASLDDVAGAVLTDESVACWVDRDTFVGVDGGTGVGDTGDGDTGDGDTVDTDVLVGADGAEGGIGAVGRAVVRAADDAVEPAGARGGFEAVLVGDVGSRPGTVTCTPVAAGVMAGPLVAGAGLVDGPDWLTAFPHAASSNAVMPWPAAISAVLRLARNGIHPA